MMLIAETTYITHFCTASVANGEFVMLKIDADESFSVYIAVNS